MCGWVGGCLACCGPVVVLRVPVCGCAEWSGVPVYKGSRVSRWAARPSHKPLHLGHRLPAEGVLVDPRKAQSVVQWATPPSCCDVRRFTRLANYFRRFVEGYAKVAEVNPRDPLCGGYQRPRVLVRSSLSPAPQNSGATPAPPPPVPPNDVSTGATPAPPPPVPPNDLFLSPTFVQALATELDPIFGPIRRGAAAALSRLVDRHGASVTDPAPNPANRRAGRFRCVVASCIAEDRSRRRRAGCAGAPRLP